MAQTTTSLVLGRAVAELLLQICDLFSDIIKQGLWRQDINTRPEAQCHKTSFLLAFEVYLYRQPPLGVRGSELGGTMPGEYYFCGLRFETQGGRKSFPDLTKFLCGRGPICRQVEVGWALACLR